MSPTYINGRFLTQPLSGMQRYAGEMVTAIDRLLCEGRTPYPVGRLEVLVPRGPRRSYDWQAIGVREVGTLHGHTWEQVDLPLASRDGVLVNLTSCGPLAHTRSLLVMHDAAIFAHPSHFSVGYRTFHRFLRPRLARRAKRVVTISEFSRRELSRWCGVAQDKFCVIGDSAEHITHVTPDPGVLGENGLQRGKFALMVGNQSPNKNIELAVRAFEQVAPQGWKLALAGGSASIFGNTDGTSGYLITRLGRVSDGQLRALYENAGLFLFPSRYEGFGVPPLEAMALGCAVLSSNSSAMPEVLGDAAAYFESDSLEDLKVQIAKLCSDDALRRSYAIKGPKRACQYSWSASAKAMLEVLASL